MIHNQGARVYLGGGARSFGAAMEAELHRLMEQHLHLSSEEATEYLQRMVKEGRLLEDLAD